MIERVKDDYDRKPVVGDQMYYRGSMNSSPQLVGIVTKITPAGRIVTSLGYTLRPDMKESGEASQRHGRKQMFVVTGAVLDERRKWGEFLACLTRIRNARWSDLPLEVLQSVAKILDDHKQSTIKTSP